ncbi:transketolase [Marinomonas sp. CT5]|uniref:transketolase family protein n=1 Tax=Marinomonas sp. CT5 TaxID=2066133 RepID=UPI001BAEC442|nr:transketolase C-terminal domain-containing protein [Marinomonas sp. CT5]QUX97724.1 transketolase [Marinomonas sp. CT5]
MSAVKPMRDVLIEEITLRMDANDSIFFVSGDFGSPKLDALRERHPDRFINVGIAEQNLINICAGLALEGFIVYAYAIAPFITMRCYEQIRVNMAILSQERPMNVNLIGVGAGYSYEMSGPTHQSLEDLAIMRALANVEVFSPADWATVESYVDYTVESQTIKYLRLDSKPLPNVHQKPENLSVSLGYHELQKGNEVCLLSTGYMTHSALIVAEKLKQEGIQVGVIDVFALTTLQRDSLSQTLQNYKHAISLEEGFLEKGGFDTLISGIIRQHELSTKFHGMGVDDHYSFELGGRDILHSINKIGIEDIIEKVKANL